MLWTFSIWISNSIHCQTRSKSENISEFSNIQCESGTFSLFLFWDYSYITLHLTPIIVVWLQISGLVGVTVQVVSVLVVGMSLIQSLEKVNPIINATTCPIVCALVRSPPTKNTISVTLLICWHHTGMSKTYSSMSFCTVKKSCSNAKIGWSYSSL